MIRPPRRKPTTLIVLSLSCYFLVNIVYGLSFPIKKDGSPFLYLITHQRSCDSDDDVQWTIESLKDALDIVDVLSIRVRRPEAPDRQHEDRVRVLIRSVLESPSKCRVVVTSDWMDIGMEEQVDGIHFKESHRHCIPNIPRNQFLVGTSTHSLESALEAVESYTPDYLICGTCYPTESHPEKTAVEGPELPALIKKELLQRNIETPVIAIGGLDAANAQSQVIPSSFVPGVCADGVAVIRGIMDAEDPRSAAQELRRRLNSAFDPVDSL